MELFEQKILMSNCAGGDISSGLNLKYSSACPYNGISVHNIPNMIKLEYDGLLAKSGAKEVFAVFGYGDNDDWQDVSTLPMQLTSKNTFELITMRKREGNINICFKDSAGNWDNNMGSNYIFGTTLQ